MLLKMYWSRKNTLQKNSYGNLYFFCEKMQKMAKKRVFCNFQFSDKNGPKRSKKVQKRSKKGPKSPFWDFFVLILL